ncbi:MAG: DUF58 domain-containing protein [Candidatus Methanoglobus sp.]
MIRKIIATAAIVLLAQAYLFLNIFPAVIAFLLLIYLLYICLEFNPKIEAERDLPEKLYDDVRTKARLRIKNLTRKDYIVRIKERLPEGFFSEEPEFVLGKMEGRSVDYWIIPSRGVYRIKGPEIHVGDMRGILKKKFQLDSLKEVEVLPSVEKLREEAKADANIRLSRKSRLGTSVEFESLRKFQIGDDSRRIDWKASVRLGELIVREFLKEWEGDVYIALDVGREMRKGKPSKLDYAISLIYQISMALKEKKLGLVLYDEFGVRKVLRATTEKEKLLMEIKFPRMKGVQSLKVARLRIEKSILRKSPARGFSLSLLSSIPQKSFVIFITDLSTNVGELLNAILQLRDSKSIVVSPNPILFSEIKMERDEILRLYKGYVEREELIRRMNRIVPTIDVGPRDLLSEIGAFL